MKFNVNNTLTKELVLKEDLDITNLDLSLSYSLKAVNKLSAEAHISTTGDITRVELFIDASVNLECAYTLEIIPQDYSLEEELYFTLTEEDETEDIYYEQGPIIDLNDYIYGLLVASIPLRVVKPGAKLPEGFANVEVISEDEFNENKKKRPTPFDDLDLDEFPD